MIFEQLRAGGDRNFTYVAADPDSKHGVVVDPSFGPQAVLEYARDHGIELEFVINTHSHYDHTDGNETILLATKARLVGYGLHGRGTAVGDGDVLQVGKLALTIIHTPGHTSDSICVLVGGKLMTGDTLFVGKVGGTGFGDDARQEYDSLHRKILTLPDETEIYPGHDYGLAPSSTVAHERKTNPFLVCPSFEEFVALKRHWPEYKRLHGIK